MPLRQEATTCASTVNIECNTESVEHSLLILYFAISDDVRSDLWRVKYWRKMRGCFNGTRVHSRAAGVITAQVADTASTCTVHTDGPVTVSPGICQNNNCLQNKSVILMDNFGTAPIVISWNIYSQCSSSSSSAALPDRSSAFLRLSTLQRVKATAAVMCINRSLRSHDTQSKPFTLIKIFKGQIW